MNSINEIEDLGESGDANNKSEISQPLTDN